MSTRPNPTSENKDEDHLKLLAIFHWRGFAMITTGGAKLVEDARRVARPARW